MSFVYQIKRTEQQSIWSDYYYNLYYILINECILHPIIVNGSD